MGYKLSLPLLCCLPSEQNSLCGLQAKKAGIMQAESPVDDPMFFSIFFTKIRPSSLLSDSTDPTPDVTINLGVFGDM